MPVASLGKDPKKTDNYLVLYLPQEGKGQLWTVPYIVLSMAKGHTKEAMLHNERIQELDREVVAYGRTRKSIMQLSKEIKEDVLAERDDTWKLKKLIAELGDSEWEVGKIDPRFNLDKLLERYLAELME